MYIYVASLEQTVSPFRVNTRLFFSSDSKLFFKATQSTQILIWLSKSGSLDAYCRTTCHSEQRGLSLAPFLEYIVGDKTKRRSSKMPIVQERTKTV